MGKPQDLPAGESQMRVGIALAFVTYVIAMVQPLGFFTASLQAVIDLVGTAFLLWFALYQTNRLPRMQQAFGGLCGASALINIASIPIIVLRPPSGEAPLGGLANFVLLVWGLSLLAHVIRHTFEVKMPFSILIAYVYFVIWSTIVRALVPLPNLDANSQISNQIMDLAPGPLLLVIHTPPFDSLFVNWVVALSPTVV